MTSGYQRSEDELELVMFPMYDDLDVPEQASCQLDGCLVAFVLGHVRMTELVAPR